MTDTTRDAFEAWATSQGYGITRDENVYRGCLTEFSWESWKAATLAEKRQPLTDEQIKSACGASDEYWSTAKLYCIAITRITEAAHGIKA